MVSSQVSRLPGMRVIALPLTRPVLPNASASPFVFYYVQSPPRPPSNNPNWFANSTAKAAAMWASWGEAPKDSWKYKTFKWGERVADRVEFEETALRVIDTTYKTPEIHSLPEKDATRIPLLYPSLLAGPDPLDSWQSHIQFRIPYHKRYMNLWLLGLPITVPIGIAPIIPNIPFYFCAWRAWCHWKAWNGARYINPLLEANIVTPVQSELLDKIYAEAHLELQYAPQPIPSASSQAPSESPSTEGTPTPPVLATSHEQQLLLTPSVIPKLLSTLELPAIAGAEILRAIEQVKHRRKRLQG